MRRDEPCAYSGVARPEHAPRPARAGAVFCPLGRVHCKAYILGARIAPSFLEQPFRSYLLTHLLT